MNKRSCIAVCLHRREGFLYQAASGPMDHLKRLLCWYIAAAVFIHPTWAMTHLSPSRLERFINCIFTCQFGGLLFVLVWFGLIPSRVQALLSPSPHPPRLGMALGRPVLLPVTSRQRLYSVPKTWSHVPMPLHLLTLAAPGPPSSRSRPPSNSLG